MKAAKFQNLLDEVNEYYTGKIKAHGPVARGVDWNGEESQSLRYQQLLRLREGIDGDFSINDVGCGYGFLFETLTKTFGKFSYFGADISSSMLEVAKQKYGKDPRCHLMDGIDKLPVSDITVASGLFNLKLSQTEELWKEYVGQTLDLMAIKSDLGFSFNMLTSYSDPEKMRTDLFYADPLYYFDLCKRKFSKHVALLHDYGLYEFTILVRK